MGKGDGQEHNHAENSGNSDRLFALQPFEQIAALTDVAEGTVVRVINRLDETCREVRDAARVIGDAELFKKMEECQIKIKRDSEWPGTLKKTLLSMYPCVVVFATSLYF